MTFVRARSAWLLAVLVHLAAVGCGDDDAGAAGDAGGMDSGGSGGSSGTGGSGGANDASDTNDASDHNDASDNNDAGSIDATVADGNQVPDAATCQSPVVALHESMGGAHVGSNAGVTYNSNPPSSGPHCGSWGRYAIYGASKPLPRCNYIHNLEHGAVVLLYKCDGACPEVVAALTEVRDRIVDAQCLSAKRVILTPDENLDTLVAASAWRNTWTSDCVNDAAMISLEAFINDNVGDNGLAPESNVCGDGSVTP